MKGLSKRFFGTEWFLPDSLDVPNKLLHKTGTGLSWSLLALGSGEAAHSSSYAVHYAPVPAVVCRPHAH